MPTSSEVKPTLSMNETMAARASASAAAPSTPQMSMFHLRPSVSVLRGVPPPPSPAVERTPRRRGASTRDVYAAFDW